MVDFIKHAMPFHLAQELDPKMDEIKKRVTRAFLMVDIHARQVEIMSSGAVVAVCLIQVIFRKRENENAFFEIRSFQPRLTILRFMDSEIRCSPVAFVWSQQT